MMTLKTLDYRFAEIVLEHASFGNSKAELLHTFENLEVPLLNPALVGRRGGVKRRKRAPLKGTSKARYSLFPVDQIAMNKQLDIAFGALGWEPHPLIVKGHEGGPVTGLRGDYQKGRLEVEVQFGNMARWYTDVFKFQLSYSQNYIDAAVLVVPMQRFANLIDENVAHFERVSRELPWAKMSLTLPILVLGIEPQDYGSIRTCYEQAAANVLEALAERGEDGIVIPFTEQLIQEAAEAEE